jgi:hypothetical protein
MADESFRIAELMLEGDTCGHILAKLALEAVGRDNPDLVRAMSALPSAWAADSIAAA